MQSQWILCVVEYASLTDEEAECLFASELHRTCEELEETIAFYQKLGFIPVLRTVNEQANEKVAFLRLHNLNIETYENKAAEMKTGAIDHIAINCVSIEDAFSYINKEGLNNTSDTIHFLPFWEHGVRFFAIEGPNCEKIEFSQFL